MTLALLYIAQHVSDVNTSIFRSLRLLVLCRLNHYSDTYIRIPHHQQTIPLHNTSTPQVSLHNTTSTRQLLKMDVLMSETCWAIYNKASVIQLVNLYSNIYRDQLMLAKTLETSVVSMSFKHYIRNEQHIYPKFEKSLDSIITFLFPDNKPTLRLSVSYYFDFCVNFSLYCPSNPNTKRPVIPPSLMLLIQDPIVRCLFINVYRIRQSLLFHFPWFFL